MATKRSQRIAIWVIAVVMTIGTIGSFVVVILANNNQKIDQQNAAAQQQKAIDAYLASNKPLPGYSAAPFDKTSVTALKVDTLKQGTGAPLKADSTITANYFGWTSDGKIFDSSDKNGTVSPATFSLSGVIKGWTQGLTGVPAGSVVKLTIPADLAYGSAGSPPTIGPDEPLQFIVDIKSVK